MYMGDVAFRNPARNNTIKKTVLDKRWERQTLVCDSDDFVLMYDCKTPALQHWFVKKDCFQMTSLECDAFVNNKNWPSVDTEKYREACEHISHCLVSVAAVARLYLHRDKA